MKEFNEFISFQGALFAGVKEAITGDGNALDKLNDLLPALLEAGPGLGNLNQVGSELDLVTKDLLDESEMIMYNKLSNYKEKFRVPLAKLLTGVNAIVLEAVIDDEPETA